MVLRRAQMPRRGPAGCGSLTRRALSPSYCRIALLRFLYAAFWRFVVRCRYIQRLQQVLKMRDLLISHSIIRIGQGIVLCRCRALDWPVRRGGDHVVSV